MSRKDENYLRARSPRSRSISSMMKTVIHLGFTNEKNMEIFKYRNFENVENSFTVIENLMMENSTEILNKSKNDCRSSWSSQEVVKDKDTRLLELSIMSWKNDLFKRRDKRKMDHPSDQFKMYSVANEFYGTDGQAIEFEWTIPRTTLQI